MSASIPPFRNAKLLIDRAKEHFTELDSLLEDFFCPENLSKIVDINPSTGYETHKLRINGTLPDKAEIVAGEVLSSLRHALAHAVTGSVRALNGIKGTNVYFPISDSVDNLA